MFTPIKQWAEQDTESYIIKKSTTLAIGDAVQFDNAAGSGYLVGCASTTSAVYGVVVGFVASPGGYTQQNLQGTTVVATATNQTTEMYRARVLPVRQSRLFLADLSQTAGVTSGSGDPGFFSIASTNGTLAETSYAIQTATALQFFSVGSGAPNVGSPTTDYSSNGPVGLFPATDHQVIGFFSNSKTV